MRSQKGSVIMRNDGQKSNRGFASMDPEEVREVARMGGEAAHEYGTAHEWDSEEARRAGHLGGLARWRSSNRGGSSGGRGRGGSRRGFAAMDRDEVRRIARMGGESSRGGRTRR